MISNITRFPTNSTQRLQNRLGPGAVICAVTDRWLRFSDEGSRLSDGKLYAFIEGMTHTPNGDPDSPKPRRA